MSARKHWSREELLIAFNLYCRLPFGQFHSRNKEIITTAELLHRTPAALSMKLCNIASLDPQIISSGRVGLKGASKADREMWHEMMEGWDRFAIASEQALQQLIDPLRKLEDESQQQKVGKDASVAAKRRIGQELFRKSVLSAYDFKCCITGLKHSPFLIASHIIPWSVDMENRLNPQNGLSLSALHDKAFDLGLLTISEDFCVIVSDTLFDQPDNFTKDSILRYHQKPISLPHKFVPDDDLLRHHRENIFNSRKLI